ncbi:MAG: pstS [Frankiales bacterium]|nr:pstS [Frankiales bacterium]
MKRLLLLLMLVPFLAVPPAQAADYVPVTGAGSTWSQVAIDAWRADIRANGVVVNYSGTGSTDGRAQYMQHTVDFGVSEIPFQDPAEPGQQVERPDRAFAYLPIVAGGTSFMYHLTAGGKQVRDLKLSGQTLALIYTGAITRWSDPRLTKENGRQLPDEPIVPVLRSDGSGATAQFTRYLSREVPSTWCPFARVKFKTSGCPTTSFYPTFTGSKSQVGSNGVADYVSASYGEGAIGYVEYAYAKRVDYPVAGLLNKAGYYAQPSASNVAVALTKAQINADLTQDLDAVYRNPDPRTYPMSSYSYMIVPTTTVSPMTTDKGRSLSTFINYFLCAGQKKAGILGYSPLPANLVTAGFNQVRKIPGYVAPPSLSSCDNPALTILRTAPQPDRCDAATRPASCGGTAVNPAPGAVTTSNGPVSNGNPGGGPASSPGASSSPGTTSSAGPGGVPVAPPGATSGPGAVLAAVRVADLPLSGRTKSLYGIAAGLIVGAVVAPPLLARRVRRRRL